LPHSNTKEREVAAKQKLIGNWIRLETATAVIEETQINLPRGREEGAVKSGKDDGQNQEERKKEDIFKGAVLFMR